MRGSQCLSVVPVFVLIDDFQFRFGIRCQLLLGKWSGVVLIIVLILAVLVFAVVVFVILLIALILPPTTRKVQPEIWLIGFIISLAANEDLFGFARGGFGFARGGFGFAGGGLGFAGVFVVGICVRINSICSRASVTAYDGVVFILAG